MRKRKAAKEVGMSGVVDLLGAIKAAKPTKGFISGRTTRSVTLTQQQAKLWERALTAIFFYGEAADTALGLKRGRGKKVHAQLEVARRRALALQLEFAIHDHPGVACDTLARRVASGPVGKIGREVPFTARYVRILHRRLAIPQGKLPPEVEVVLRDFVRLMPRTLRIRYEQ